MDATEALRQRNLKSAGLSRWICAALAVVLPLALFGLFRRQENRLRALVDHGRQTVATKTSAGGIIEYRYKVDGQSLTWSVGEGDEAYATGPTFAVTYLPEVPSFSRPGQSYPKERFELEDKPTFKRLLLGGLFCFFAVFAIWSEVTLRRLRVGVPRRTTPRLTPVGAGRLVAALLLVATLGVNFDPKVTAVQAAVFGSRPFGLNLTLVVVLAQAVLFAPMFSVFPHLMRIVMDAFGKGGSVSKSGIVEAVFRAGPELRRSRLVVLAGFAYFVALMAAWIALASHRGV